ncbi:hypothetical protein EPI10_001080 [Gossypium australe]|uniref:Uncharacterized protein n=1 Tax=Gossypium australe TaxID=47621 RepID=A0A5B6V9Y7_9ROSI|nr:hypothetical protein EPI10_001080 [Gossypium australe]
MITKFCHDNLHLDNRSSVEVNDNKTSSIFKVNGQRHIMTQDHQINVGSIIFREVHRYSQKNTDTLNFPLLITILAKVPIQTNKDTIPNKGAIIKQLALRFSREEMPRHPGSTSTLLPPMTTDTAPSTSLSNFQQKVIDVLEMLQQQFRIMEKHQQRPATNFGRVQKEMALFWGYV